MVAWYGLEERVSDSEVYSHSNAKFSYIFKIELHFVVSHAEMIEILSCLVKPSGIRRIRVHKSGSCSSLIADPDLN